LLFDVQDLLTKNQTSITGKFPTCEEASRRGYLQKEKSKQMHAIASQIEIRNIYYGLRAFTG